MEESRSLKMVKSDAFLTDVCQMIMSDGRLNWTLSELEIFPSLSYSV